ncbi:MAG TPA: peptidoglycan-binding protein [Pyrinomonadaceae bacterium]|nr:peptidoglycan-binding protein [Pyrinomonadaceae bacterium]
MSVNFERTGSRGIDAERLFFFNSEGAAQGDGETAEATQLLLDLTASNPDILFERQLIDTGSLFKARFMRQDSEREPTTETRQVRRTSAVTADSSPEELARDPRVRAMLDVLGFTEGTGDNYGRVVYGTVVRAPHNPELVGRRNVVVDDFSRHPNILVQVRPGLRSTAAGRYQFLKGTWDGLGMSDFSPRSQDIAAVKLMQRRGMIEPLLRGDIRTAVFRGAPEWASLPTERGGSFYGGQPARTIREIETEYNSSLARQENSPTPVEQPRGGVPDVSLNRGDRGPNVRALQDTLVRLGHLSAAQVRTGPGIYGPQTETAVKEFQSANGLAPSGNYDGATETVMRAIVGGVERGSRGDVVRALQNRLVELNYMSAAQVRTGPGIFGRQTEDALKRFQADHGIRQTGVLGPTTYAALQRAAGAGAINGDARNYRPYTLYSSGAGSVRRVEGYDQLLAHHDYQTVRRGGRNLEVRDIVLTHPGEANSGQTIPSPISGRVVRAGVRGGYGNSVEVVNDRTGQRFLIGHMRRIDVREGQQITYGQSIGQQGTTGNSTGPHVHIEAESAVIRRWMNDLLDGRFDGVRSR